MSSGDLVLGVISDTHGLVRPEALAALAGVAQIFHAGDIGGRPVLDALAAIAPVTAVRGNNDRDPWGRTLPETVLVEVAGASIYMLHDLNQLDLDPRAAGVDIVISGHSHRPAQHREHGVLYLNPGSAGPRRFRLPISLARLRLGATVTAELIELALL
jgi:hypothetical protein